MAKELMRLTYETLVDKRHALGLLEKVKREGDALIYSENKLNREKTEFNKHLHEESFKTKERLEKIHSLEKIYERKKVELVDIHKQIELAKMRSENLKKESRTPEVLENYRPYEELISEVLEKLPQCKNVFDIISNVVNLNTTVKLDSELFKTDDDTYENLEIISAILQQYMDLYLKNCGYFPMELPSTEDQLVYIFEFFKRTLKQLEINNNLVSGKMTRKDYYMAKK